MTKKTRNILILAVVIPMLVIGIFAVKAAFILYGAVQHARTEAAHNGIEDIKKALQIYQMKHAGRGPAGIDDLLKDTDENPALLKSDCRLDPWRTPYLLEKNGKTWRITSAGPDSKFGTEDDLTNEWFDFN